MIGRSNYHRQILLDHAASRSLVIDDAENPQKFLSDYKWYFHTWAPRGREVTIRRDGKSEKIWVNPGIPFGDSRANPVSRNVFDEVRGRLASAPTSGKWLRTIGQETYGQNLSRGFHIAATERASKMQMFDFMNALREAQLGSAFSIPPEVDELFSELADNLEIQLIADIVQGLDDIDPFWDIPFDRWRDALYDKAAGLPVPFAECD